jgi:dCMP deaminase
MNDDLRWLHRAYDVAKTSPDPRTQNGAVLVNPDNWEIGSGPNRFALGVQHTHERWHTDLKYDFILHAERSAIYAAVRGLSCIPGSTLYCPWAACDACALTIIECGIKRVVGHKSVHHVGRPDWEASIGRAMEMFKEAGVTFEELEHHFGIKLRFGGQEVEF